MSDDLPERDRSFLPALEAQEAREGMPKYVDFHASPQAYEYPVRVTVSGGSHSTDPKWDANKGGLPEPVVVPVHESWRWVGPFGWRSDTCALGEPGIAKDAALHFSDPPPVKPSTEVERGRSGLCMCAAPVLRVVPTFPPSTVTPPEPPPTAERISPFLRAEIERTLREGEAWLAKLREVLGRT